MRPVPPASTHVRTSLVLASVVLCSLLLGLPLLGCATSSTSASASRGGMGSASKHCGVTVFEEAPSFPTENLGPVRARCDLDVSDEDCLGTLKEQVCRLGGDVVWGVASQPTIEEERKVFRGRAVKRR